MVFIALALLGIAYTVLTTQFGFYANDRFHMPEDLALCQLGKIKVYATTTDESLSVDRFITKEIMYPGGTQVVSVNLTSSAFPLRRGQKAIQILEYDCGNPSTGCSSGSYTVTLATSSMRLQRPVQC